MHLQLRALRAAFTLSRRTVRILALVGITAALVPTAVFVVTAQLAKRAGAAPSLARVTRSGEARVVPLIAQNPTGSWFWLPDGTIAAQARALSGTQNVGAGGIWYRQTLDGQPRTLPPAWQHALSSIPVPQTVQSAAAHGGAWSLLVAGPPRSRERYCSATVTRSGKTVELDWAAQGAFQAALLPGGNEVVDISTAPHWSSPAMLYSPAGKLTLLTNDGTTSGADVVVTATGSHPCVVAGNARDGAINWRQVAITGRFLRSVRSWTAQPPARSVCLTVAPSPRGDRAAAVLMSDSVPSSGPYSRIARVWITGLNGAPGRAIFSATQRLDEEGVVPALSQQMPAALKWSADGRQLAFMCGGKLYAAAGLRP